MSNTKLATPLMLPSGLVLPNRLVKSAMVEALADANNDPSDRHIIAYRKWAEGGWGGLLTGNVDVSETYMGGPADVLVHASPTPSSLTAWQRWAAAVQGSGTPGIVQLVHPGRQSWPGAQRSFFAKTIAPSAVPLVTGPGLFERLLSRLLWGTPREMSVAEIEEVPRQFAHAAKFASEAGFAGVEVHGAHGYLVTQFLSARTNWRSDGYGGTPAKRARLLVEIVRAIRGAVPGSFSVGVKFNSADVGGEESLEESLEQVGLVVAEGVDYLEISGGTYENFLMAGSGGEVSSEAAQRTAQREAFFLDYARVVRERFPEQVLMVTGGFRSRKGMLAALESGACDLIGVGRPAVVWPHLPKEVLLNEVVPDNEASASLAPIKPSWFVKSFGVKMINASVDSAYYVKQILLLAAGKPTAPPPVKS